MYGRHVVNRSSTRKTRNPVKPQTIEARADNGVDWPIVFVMVLIAFGLFSTARCAMPEAGVKVVVKPWDSPEVQCFDPCDPPTNPPLPTLSDGTVAVADSTPRVSLSGHPTSSRRTWSADACTCTYTVLSFDVTVSGHTRIRVPNNVSDEIREHENGHDRLNEYEYNQNAKEKVEDAFRKLLGITFHGQGCKKKECFDDAKAKAKAKGEELANCARDAIRQQMDTLAGKYDKLTNHGRSEEVNTAEGEEEAKKERDKAPEAGESSKEPDPSQPSSGVGEPPQPPEKAPHSSGSGEETRTFFDKDMYQLSFEEGRLLNFASNPSDPILNRGEVWIDPMVLIGVQENGTISLSDTRLRIIDFMNGDMLLDGFLLEIAYMPSSSTGFSRRIQAYLDIPPDWAGGINNTIGSDFLAGMQAASEASNGYLPMFWFYADQDLFSEDGQSLIPDTGVTGTLTLGLAIPDPRPPISIDPNEVNTGISEPQDPGGPPPTRPTQGELGVYLGWQPGESLFYPNFTATVNVDPNTEGDGPHADLVFPDSVAADGSVNLTFTQANWNVPQNVIVQAVQDTDREGNERYQVSLTVTIDIDDPNFQDKTVFTNIVVIDNDIPYISVSPDCTELSESDPCTAKCLNVRLSHLPTADVMVLVSPEGRAVEEEMIRMVPPLTEADDPNKLIFTTGTWNINQQICLYARDNDWLTEAGERYIGGEVVLTPYSEDVRYRVPGLSAYGEEEENSGGLCEETIVEYNVKDDECGAWGYDFADFNEDCVVNLADAAQMYAQWLMCTQPYEDGCLKKWEFE